MTSTCGTEQLYFNCHLIRTILQLSRVCSCSKILISLLIAAQQEIHTSYHVLSILSIMIHHNSRKPLTLCAGGGEESLLLISTSSPPWSYYNHNQKIAGLTGWALKAFQWIKVQPTSWVNPKRSTDHLSRQKDQLATTQKLTKTSNLCTMKIEASYRINSSRHLLNTATNNNFNRIQ